MRRFVADTLCMVIFSTVCGMAIEILIAGLTFGQSLQTRMTAIPANVLTARPYGMYRDWVLRSTGATGSLALMLADIGAFVTFQVPLYAAILASSGATMPQIFAACTSVTISSLFMGRPYGIFLEFMRRVTRA